MIKMLNLYADYYVEKYPRSKLMWVEKNDIAEYMLRGAKIVDRDPREYTHSETRIRTNQNPRSTRVQHVSGTTLFRICPRLYDRYRLAPTRKRNRAIQAALRPSRKWLARWWRRIKVLLHFYKEEQLDFWGDPSPPTYFDDNKARLEALDFNVDAAEAEWHKPYSGRRAPWLTVEELQKRLTIAKHGNTKR